MMNRQYSQMLRKKWIVRSLITLLVIAFISFIYAIFLYQDIYNSKTTGFADTEREIIAQTAMTEINKIELFNGDKSYHVVFGKNKDNNEKIIFYPLEGKEKNILTLDASEIISEDKIVNAWGKQCSDCKLVKVSPALIDKEALWEVAYYEKNDQSYVLDYLSMYDASRKEKHYFDKLVRD